MRCIVLVYTDLVTERDKSHSKKRFQNVQSRVERVVATRVTCYIAVYYGVQSCCCRHRKIVLSAKGERKLCRQAENYSHWSWSVNQMELNLFIASFFITNIFLLPFFKSNNG